MMNNEQSESPLDGFNRSAAEVTRVASNLPDPRARFEQEYWLQMRSAETQGVQRRLARESLQEEDRIQSAFAHHVHLAQHVSDLKREIVQLDDVSERFDDLLSRTVSKARNREILKAADRAYKHPNATADSLKIAFEASRNAHKAAYHALHPLRRAFAQSPTAAAIDAAVKSTANTVNALIMGAVVAANADAMKSLVKNRSGVEIRASLDNLRKSDPDSTLQNGTYCLKAESDAARRKSLFGYWRGDSMTAMERKNMYRSAVLTLDASESIHAHAHSQEYIAANRSLSSTPLPRISEEAEAPPRYSQVTSPSRQSSLRRMTSRV